MTRYLMAALAATLLTLPAPAQTRAPQSQAKPVVKQSVRIDKPLRVQRERQEEPMRFYSTWEPEQDESTHQRLQREKGFEEREFPTPFRGEKHPSPLK